MLNYFFRDDLTARELFILTTNSISVGAMTFLVGITALTGGR